MDYPVHCKVDGIPVIATPRDVSAIDPYCCNMRRDSWFMNDDDISATESDFFRPPLDPWRMKYYPCSEAVMYGPQPAVEFFPTYPPPFPPPVSRHPPKISGDSTSSLRKAKYYFCPRCFRYGVMEPMGKESHLTCPLGSRDKIPDSKNCNCPPGECHFNKGSDKSAKNIGKTRSKDKNKTTK